MKKGQIIEGIISKIEFPNKGIIQIEDGKKVVVKNGVVGQKVSVRIRKVRKGKGEGDIQELLEKSPLELPQPNCEHFGICGGCTYQTISYEEQLKLKEKQVKDLLMEVYSGNEEEFSQKWEGIK